MYIMEERKIVTSVLVYSYEELPEQYRKLVDEAKRVTGDAYAPYSKFHVGAAVLLENGEIVQGSNQENVAYPSGLCAERTAIFYAGAAYPGVKFKKLAIAAYSDGDFVEEPVSPCGACRQSILEYEKLGGEPIEIILIGRNKVYKIEGVRTLLPLSFEEF